MSKIKSRPSTYGISCRMSGKLLNFHFPNYKMERSPTWVVVRIKLYAYLYYIYYVGTMPGIE